MGVVLKLFGIAILGVTAALSTKRYTPELSVAIVLASLIAAVYVSAGLISTAVEDIKAFAEGAGISEAFLKPLFKALGITVLTKIACDICKDGGAASTAGYIELAGGAAVLMIAMPLVNVLLEKISL